MSVTGIEIEAERMEQVRALLAGVPKGAERAFSNAINRGLSRIKSQAWKQVKQVYTEQSSALNAATTTQVQKASAGNLAGYIHFSGVKIPLYKFKVSPKQPGSGQRVKASVKKGGGATFESAFIAAMKSGHVGVFERDTRKRLPVSEFMGLSAAQMVGEQTVSTELQEEAQRTVNERLDHEIDRLLNGYGG